MESLIQLECKGFKTRCHASQATFASLVPDVSFPCNLLGFSFTSKSEYSYHDTPDFHFATPTLNPFETPGM